MALGVDSASERNKYQESFWGSTSAIPGLKKAHDSVRRE
jgi:hypothetical protein